MDGRKPLLSLTLPVIFVLLSAASGNFKQAAASGNFKQAASDTSGSINIDCGADQDYLDEETGIFYHSDKDFISTGKNQYESPGNFERIAQSLRYFPKGIKNCYTLRPEQRKNQMYLIRTFFFYGNYDAKNQFPKFDLYLGGDHWVTVQARSTGLDGEFHEIFYFSPNDAINLCLINTGYGTPFISAIEVRFVKQSIYRVNSRSLCVMGHFDLGYQTNMRVRYKDDVYDRFWYQYTCNSCVTLEIPSNIDVQSSNNTLQIPLQVLRTSNKPPSSLRSFDLSGRYTYYYGYDYEFYACFYFAENEELQISQGKPPREFTITFNGAIYGPFTLRYLKPLAICSGPSKSRNPGHLEIFINSTARSELPPIVNGFDMFSVMPPPLSPTDPADVDAITTIQQTYKVNQDDSWQGDPCLPKNYTWTGLNCSYDRSSPRIISVNLSACNLAGEISSSFSKLKAIQSLDLSGNELTGTVPEFLAQLPNLTVLNLTGNKLTGSVPLSLVQKSNNGLLQLSLEGNPNLCQTDSCKNKKQNVLLPIAASVATVMVLLLLSSIFFFRRMKRQEATSQSKKEGLVILTTRSFSYLEITTITKNFETVIGEGGFGKVYLGTLENNTQVAVKLLSQNSRQGYKEFQSEAKLLMIVHHKNLVSLIGYCDDGHNKALIYEYIVNGNLQEQLSGTNGSTLNWNKRMQIAADAAQGLEYLHNGCRPPIIHRDLKTSNILLNERFQAKIADFGLSRAFANESGSHITTCPAGTLGYLDPEAAASGNFNKKSDIYSFGIILLELITGQPAIKRDVNGENIPIQQWVTPIIENGDIRSIVDPRLQGDFNTNSAWKAVEIAMLCIQDNGNRRPDMIDVLVELKECLAAVGSPRMDRGRTRSMTSHEMMSLEIDTEMAPCPR